MLPKFAKKFLKRLIWSVALGAIIFCMVVGGGYVWFANSKLPRTLEQAGIEAKPELTYHLVHSRNAGISTRWPMTLRVDVVEKARHGWKVTPNGRLVTGSWIWFPEEKAWREEGLDGVSVSDRIRLEALIQTSGNGRLIETLRKEDAMERAVAYKELRIRTQQTFSYDPWKAPRSQEPSIQEWERWWEANKKDWTGRDMLDKVREVFETR